MRCRVPVRHFVFGVIARIRNDSVDVFPVHTKQRLQRQLPRDFDEPHRSMRCGLLDMWRKQEGSRRRQVAEADIREMWAFGQFNLQQHVDRRTWCVNGHAAHHPTL